MIVYNELLQHSLKSGGFINVDNLVIALNQRFLIKDKKH